MISKLNVFGAVAATACVLSLSIASSAEAASVSVIDGHHDVINGQSGTGDPGLVGLGHTSTLFSDSAGGHAAALAAGNTIVIEQAGTDAASSAAYSSFISSGGRVIVLGGGGSTMDAFMNGIFGTSIGTGSSFGTTFGKTAAASGTTFGDDAMTLVGPSSTHEVISGLPAAAEVFYAGTTGEAVLRMTAGSGDLFYLGWDYCCSGTASERADWYDVLDSAIAFDGGVEVVPLPAGMPLLVAGLGLLGYAGRRRKS